MTASMDPVVAHSYAKFLVELFPREAVEILCHEDPGNNTRLVEKRVDSHCPEFRGCSKTKVKAMIEGHEWNALRELLDSPSHIPTASRGQMRIDSGQAPPTPSLSTSGAQQTTSQRSLDWIIVLLDTGEQCRLTAISSGSDEYMIGEDKLRRFPGVVPEWLSNPRRVNVGGIMIQVEKRIRLTWTKPRDYITNYEYFWVIPSDQIKHADVLLGVQGQESRDRRDGGGPGTPLSLPLRTWNTMPAVPTAPVAVLPELHQPQHLSSGLYTTGHNSRHNYGPPPSHSQSEGRSHHAQQPYTRPDISASGARPFEPFRSVPASNPADRPPSRPQSVSSAKTTQSTRVDTVLIQLSYQGKGKRFIPLDLTKTGDEIIPWLEPHVLKVSKGEHLDRDNHELTITPLQGGDEEATSAPLSEECFDISWEGIQAYLRDNRSSESSRKVEFRFDIG